MLFDESGKEPGQETLPVRKDMALDLPRLEEFLRKCDDNVLTYKTTSTKLELYVTPPLEVKQFAYGQSNPTYFLTDAKGNRFVLRKKPAGKLISATAHNVEREFRVLDRVASHTEVPVPRVILLCTDVNVIGTSFYIMDFLNGRIFVDPLLRSVASKPDRRAIYFSIVDTLAALHRADPLKDGLAAALFGIRPSESSTKIDASKLGHFYPRMIRNLRAVSDSQANVRGKDGVAVGNMPNYEKILHLLDTNLPKDEVAFCHGDYKVDNVIIHPTEPKTLGVLDWELCTVGHPLSDLANLTLPFYGTGNDLPAGLRLLDYPGPTDIPSVEELLKRYCEQVGRPYPIPKWDFCIAFAYFRLAVITQGIAARVKLGQAKHATADAHAKLFQPVARRALEVFEHGLNWKNPTARSAKI